MNIKEMHYDVKFKLNKVDSQQYRNLKVTEIDWALNEAQEILVKLIAKPRVPSHLGFETSQRTIDDISPLVVDPDVNSSGVITITNNLVPLPEDYWYAVRGRVKARKGNCEGVLKFIPRQHDDLFEESAFHKSSFEWRTVNGLFIDKKIKLFDDGTFTNEVFYLSYIKKLDYIHNAEDTKNGRYKNLKGDTLTGTRDSILPDPMHREITDMAVALLSGTISEQNVAFNQAKIRLNQIN